MDYYSYETVYMDPAATAAFGIGTIIYMVILLAIAVISLISMWKIFAKAGEAGWKALIPIYNMYILFQITWGKGIYFLLMLIPLANFVILIITYVKLANAFGKSGAFAVGIVFLPAIFMPILAFGSAEYQSC